LQAESAEENLERGRDDLEFDVGAFAEVGELLEFGARQVEAHGDEDVDRLAGEEGAEFFVTADDAGGCGVAGKRDDADDAVGMGGQAADFEDELAGFIVPSEDEGALLHAFAQAGAVDEAVEGTAPNKHEGERGQIGDGDEQAGNRRFEFQHEREPEVSTEPDGRAFEDDAHALVFSQEQFFVVEVEVGVGDEQKAHAEEDERQVGGETGVGNVDAEMAQRGGVAEEVAGAEAGQGCERIADQQGQG